MEYVSKINIFGLKMIMKSGLEKIFMKSLHAQSLFWKTFFLSISREEVLITKLQIQQGMTEAEHNR